MFNLHGSKFRFACRSHFGEQIVEPGDTGLQVAIESEYK
jgi:hypothetical protein